MLKNKLWVPIVLTLLLLISGCAGSPSGGKMEQGDSKSSEITMLSSWSTDTERGRALKDVVDKYNKDKAGKYKVKLDINPDWPALQEKVKTMIAADQTPDLFNYNFNPNDLSRQKSGKLLNFKPYLDEEWKSRFSQQDLDGLTVDNQLTSVPFEKAGVLFYYNKKLFAKAGIQSFPKTWDEFFEVCEKLKQKGITPISLMTTDDAWHTTNAFSYLAASAGGVDVFKVGQPLNTPAVEKAAENLQKLFNYSTSDALGANYSVSSNHFILGQTAIIIDGPWLIGSLDKKMIDSIGVAPSPTFGDGKVKEGFIITDAHTPWSAAKQKSKEKEKAVAVFMKYLTSDKSAKNFTLNGRILLSQKMDLTDDEMKQSGPVLGQFIQVSNQSPESLVQISRVLKPSAISVLPSLIEGLVMKQDTPKHFAQKLQEANSQ